MASKEKFSDRLWRTTWKWKFFNQLRAQNLTVSGIVLFQQAIFYAEALKFKISQLLKSGAYGSLPSKKDTMFILNRSIETRFLGIIESFCSLLKRLSEICTRTNLVQNKLPASLYRFHRVHCTCMKKLYASIQINSMIVSVL